MRALLSRFRNTPMFAILACLLASTAGTTIVGTAEARSSRWSAQEREMLRSLSLSALEPLRPDPTNRVGDDPRAAALGHRLFFDTRLSGNGRVACGTCHVPGEEFQDSKPLAEGMGITSRRTMPVAGTARSPWMFWDGRMDSQWSQALGPLESAVEHGGSRTQYAHVVAAHYRTEYEAIFGALPDLAGLPDRAGPVADTTARAAWSHMPVQRRNDVTSVFANIGKAIAAYERRIAHGPSRFDRYVDAVIAGRPHTPSDNLTSDEVAGLRLFIGKGSCVNCHNGALLTDDHFHNTGVASSLLVPGVDSGRATGVRDALAGEFNCTSRHSDARAEECDELRFAVAEGHELLRAYKTPSLRNVARRAPFMHAGQLRTLEDVVAHYASAPAAPFGHSELKPLELSAKERQQLVAFLHTLTGPLEAPAGFLAPPARP